MAGYAKKAGDRKSERARETTGYLLNFLYLDELLNLRLKDDHGEWLDVNGIFFTRKNTGSAVLVDKAVGIEPVDIFAYDHIPLNVTDH
ncbi:hypothetical protein PRIPAC_81712 [Pristionchus pacificus]|uniref:Uncharacterized protein n=1 Tax=Pristionchus pacificus TaxID=54126 RepID=A0A2A6CMT0_PRIPA|nr:hypothetical protein PRIPAC_81712 [Pristionchus pacificus]|eukprot:PDM79363.1 hypothetical protein PRIPAC_31942 [Pristionchus pacificus]